MPRERSDAAACERGKLFALVLRDGDDGVVG